MDIDGFREMTVLGSGKVASVGNSSSIVLRKACVANNDYHFSHYHVFEDFLGLYFIPLCVFDSFGESLNEFDAS